MFAVKSSGGMGAVPPWSTLGGIPDQPSQAGQRQPRRCEYDAGTPEWLVRGSDAGSLHALSRLEKPVLGLAL